MTYEILETPILTNDAIRYEVKIIDDSKLIYKEVYTEKEYRIYREYIQERVELLLQDCGKLHNPYVMFEVGNRMYQLDDLSYTENHRELTRCAMPIDYYEDENIKFDLVKTGDLYDFFTYEKDVLVYRFGNFYLNGELICSREDVSEEYYDIDFDIAYGKKFDSFIKGLELQKDIKLRGYISTHSDCSFSE